MKKKKEKQVPLRDLISDANAVLRANIVKVHSKILLYTLLISLLFFIVLTVLLVANTLKEFNTLKLIFLFLDIFFGLLSVSLTISYFSTRARENDTFLMVDNDRVIGTAGGKESETITASFSEIQFVSIRQSVLGRIFNYSNLKIITSYEEIEFLEVSNAEELKEYIMKRALKEKETILFA